MYEDKSGPEVVKLVEEMSRDPCWPLSARVRRTAVVADERADIQAVVRRWTDPCPAHREHEGGGQGGGGGQVGDGMEEEADEEEEEGEGCVDLLLTTGGTGFGLRDGTPEAVAPLLHRHAPGVAQALLNEGLKYVVVV